MKKEVVKKNLHEFNKWLESANSKMWMKDITSDQWYFSIPEWNAINCKYIYNDEWAELKKAQHDGKVIQVFNHVKLGHIDGTWIDKDINSTDVRIVFKHFRIKPSFSINDYVVELNPHETILQVTEMNLTNIGTDSYKLWEPTEGEWILKVYKTATGIKQAILQRYNCGDLLSKQMFYIPYLHSIPKELL